MVNKIPSIHGRYYLKLGTESLGASIRTCQLAKISVDLKTPIPGSPEVQRASKEWRVNGKREERALLFFVSTQELGARAHGQAVGTVNQVDSLKVIWALAGESFASCFDEAEMRAATIVGTTGIIH